MLTRNAGDSIRFDIEVKDADGVAVTLAGATVYGAIKKDASVIDDDSDIFVTVTSHSDAVNGITAVEFPKAETLLLERGIYTLGIKVIFANGNADTILTTQIQILPAIIRKVT